MSAVALPLATHVTPAVVAGWVRSACLAELRALKPGNVGIHGGGHAMDLGHFIRSARVMAPALCAPGLSVGGRIHAAVAATRAAVGCNTNLGIVLLCAPLVQALLAGGPLRSGVEKVLARLDREDAAQTYAAIRLAHPGGLGTSAEHDVAGVPQVTLLEAMGAAVARDRVAAQYAGGFADLFDFIAPRLREGVRQWGSLPWAVTAAFLQTLARFPDTHILRKHGAAVAERVSGQAARLANELGRCTTPQRLEGKLRLFDEELKHAGINPGTSADLVVAGLVLCHGEAVRERE